MSDKLQEFTRLKSAINSAEFMISIAINIIDDMNISSELIHNENKLHAIVNQLEDFSLENSNEKSNDLLYLNQNNIRIDNKFLNLGKAKSTILERLIIESGFFVSVEEIAKYAILFSVNNKSIRVHMCRIRSILIKNEYPEDSIKTAKKSYCINQNVAANLLQHHQINGNNNQRAEEFI